MNEQELRALVREVIAHQGMSPVTVGGSGPGAAGLVRQHASHAMFVLPAGSEIDGPCLIEPTVACNHCGYCKSYGH